MGTWRRILVIVVYILIIPSVKLGLSVLFNLSGQIEDGTTGIVYNFGSSYYTTTLSSVGTIGCDFAVDRLTFFAEADLLLGITKYIKDISHPVIPSIASGQNMLTLGYGCKVYY